MENIRPSSDLRNKYNEMSKLCRETKEPIYLTVNGRGDTVLMGMTVYNQMTAELQLLRTLAEAQNDVENGRVASIDNTFLNLRASLLSRK